MKGRGLILGLLVVVGLALFAWFELRRDATQGVREQHELVFPYNLSRVSELRLRLGEREAHLARGDSGSWEVLEGEGIDLEYVGDLVSVWGQMRFLEVISEEPSPEDLERFGLAPARLSARAVVTTREGQRPPRNPPRLEIGGPLPLQTPGYYARVDGFERVVAVTPEAGGMLEGPGRQLFGLESRLADPEDPHGH